MRCLVFAVVTVLTACEAHEEGAPGPTRPTVVHVDATPPPAPPPAADAAVAVVAVDAPPAPEADCVGSQPELYSDGGTPVACGATSCLALDLSAKKLTPTARPTAALVATEIRGSEVCRGTTCKPIGTQLAATIAGLTKQAKGDDALQVFATDDVALVIVHLARTRGVAPELWDVAKDASVTLVRPVKADPSAPGPELTTVGNAILADWYDCAGPCHTGQLVDARGKQIGDLIAGYTTVWRVADDLFAISSDTAGTIPKHPPDEIRLYDRSGKARGHVPLKAGIVSAMIPLAKNHALAAATSENGTRVIDLEISRPNRPKVATEMTVRACAN